MQSFYLTDAGRIREHNEDSVIILKNKNNEFLMAVADGMGGHKAGEVASSIAITHLQEEFSKISSFKDKTEAKNWIKTNYEQINDKIFKYTDEHVESKGMGTTLVVAILSKEFLLFGNIGDSSGYVLKSERLFKVTNDHTLVNFLVKTGELSMEEAKVHPKKNVVMKALGAINPVEVDIFDVETTISSIMLCSDGLTTMLSNEQIEKVLNSDEAIDEKVIRLIKKSNNRGGNDNISVAYLIKEDGE